MSSKPPTPGKGAVTPNPKPATRQRSRASGRGDGGSGKLSGPSGSPEGSVSDRSPSPPVDSRPSLEENAQAAAATAKALEEVQQFRDDFARIQKGFRESLERERLLIVQVRGVGACVSLRGCDGG